MPLAPPKPAKVMDAPGDQEFTSHAAQLRDSRKLYLSWLNTTQALPPSLTQWDGRQNWGKKVKFLS